MRYWWIVVLVALSGGVVGLFLATTVFNDSRATTTILIEDPNASQVFNTGRAVQPERYLASQVAILESPEMTRAVEDAARGGLSRQDIVESRTISANREDDLIEIEFVHPEPDVAVEYANAYGRAYEMYREEVTAETFNSAISELEASIETVEQELAAIDVMIEAGTSGEQMSPIEQEILLETRREIVERHSQLVTRLDQLRVDAALTSTGITAVSEATDAALTVGRARITGIVGVLGAVGGLTMAYVLALRNRRFGHRSEPETILGVPGLAEIPELPSKRLMPVSEDPTSPAAEAFRFAASAITAQLSRPEESADSARNSVTITSALPDAGKTVVAVNVGMSVATRGKSVVLIDGNFNDRSLTRMLAENSRNHLGITDIVGNTSLTRTVVENSRNHLGITDVVEGRCAYADAVVEVNFGEGGHIDLLTRGSIDISPDDFFNSSVTQKMLNTIRMRYDYVIVDAPALLDVSYTSSIADLTDAVITVIPHHSLVSLQSEVLKRLEIVGATLKGYVYTRASRTHWPNITDAGNMLPIVHRRSENVLDG